MFPAPGVGTDVAVGLEDAAQVAAAGKSALAGDGVELEIGKREQAHRPFETQTGEGGLRAFASDLPKEPP